MDLFGPAWLEHDARLEAAWNELVQADDTVIIAGDIEWALKPEEALESLHRIDQWAGTKVLVRGNHDFWWSSKTTSKVRRILPPTIKLIHNDCVEAEGFNLCGTKGSPVPGAIEWTDQNSKLLNRETERLKLSLAARNPSLPTIIALHYPPFYTSYEASPYRRLIEESGALACVYGHLHGGNPSTAPEGRIDRCIYRLVAGDAVSFRPVIVAAGGEIVGEATGEMLGRHGIESGRR